MERLETDRLILRKVKIQDAPMIEAYAGDYEVARMTANVPHPYPKGGGISFIQFMQRAEKHGKLLLFALEEKDTGQFIGVMNLNFIKEHRRGELAYWIGKPFWGKGYSTEAAGELIKYGFLHFNLIKIHAIAFADNPGSWRVMEKIGMKREGVLRRHLIRFNEVHDVVYYGILREESLGENPNG